MEQLRGNCRQKCAALPLRGNCEWKDSLDAFTSPPYGCAMRNTKLPTIPPGIVLLDEFMRPNEEKTWLCCSARRQSSCQNHTSIMQYIE
jgi:hypothetical protein